MLDVLVDIAVTHVAVLLLTEGGMVSKIEIPVPNSLDRFGIRVKPSDKNLSQEKVKCRLDI